MANNMMQRVLFALVAIPVAVGAGWYGGPVLAGLLALAAALGARELLNFARQQGAHPWRAAAIGLAAAFPLVAWEVAIGANQFAGWVYALPVLLGLVLIHALWRVGPARKPLTSAAVTLFTPMYAGGMIAFAMLLRHGAGHPNKSIPGLLMVLFPLVLTWGCDTAAMEVGRRLGGPKLAPTVSPGKTWSGAIGGLLAALVELAGEVPREFAWKFWAHDEPFINREKLLDELVDVGHFLANMLDAIGVTDAEWEAAYQAKQAENRRRQKDGYAVRKESR